MHAVTYKPTQPDQIKSLKHSNLRPEYAAAASALRKDEEIGFHKQVALCSPDQAID
jgi:hypothetical protein